MELKNTDLLNYDLADGVVAFSTMRNAVLPYPVLQPHQVHGDEVVIVESRSLTRDCLEGVDALVTSLTGYPIAVRTADCVPVLLYDPVRRVIAAVHSGWRGTVKRISQKTIRIMTERFGTSAADLMTLIGPSIGPESFEVGQEVVDEFRAAGFPVAEINRPKFENFPQTGNTFQSGGNLRQTDMNCTSKSENISHADIAIPQTDRISQKSYIDLWKANAWLLEEAGVKRNNIQIVGIDTFQCNDLFFSARHEGRKCGRIINTIMMK